MNGNKRDEQRWGFEALGQIDGALAQKRDTGQADEARYGFAATIANATPPVDETFRRTLRASIEAEAAQSMNTRTQASTIRGQESQGHVRQRLPKLRWALGMSVAAALLLVAIATPLGRIGQSLAQSALRFFVRTERAAFPVQPGDSTPPDSSAPTAESPAPLISLAEAEAQAGFEVAELPFVPDGFTFHGARVVGDVVTIEYEAEGGGGGLVLKQSPTGFAESRWEEVPDDAVVPVSIGEIEGEFAQGTFVVFPGDETATWHPDAPISRLRWVQDGIWFELIKSGDVESMAYLDQERLTELAARLGAHAAVVDAGQEIAQEDIDALARRLGEASDPRTVAVFPARHAPALEQQLAYDVVPLAVGDDPAPGAVQAALQAALPHTGLVDVVLVDQHEGDGARRVRASLEQQLYRIHRGPGDAGAESFGALERRQYLAVDDPAPLEPVNAVFPGGIELVAGGAVDTLSHGDALPLALTWRATEPVTQELRVFAHLICGGRIIAQRDALPGNGEWPTTDWEPGTLVRDNFAVPLPDDVPSEPCELQVGLYEAESQRRLMPQGGDGSPFVIIELLSVQPAGGAL